MVEFLVDRDIDKFVDGSGNNGPAETPVIGGQVAPATDKAHAQRSSADDHLILSSASSSSSFVLVLDRLRSFSVQWPYADLLEPDDVAWIMILQPYVTDLGALWLPFRLVPLLARRHILSFGVEICNPFPIHIHRNASACECNNHCLPFAGLLFRKRRRRRQ